MNVEPKLESRGKQPYLAVRTQVGIPFGEVLPALWEEVAGFLAIKIMSHLALPSFII